ncbi:hypothetical protein A4A49_16410 [Nicotiana attenuata]|uniref:DUF4283 domain-containing protein n=1 Tax=Nicotiana attenuata TaxID=49451 RepID=A0A314L9E1_NICAT|nr:hypothetical protein A4A49_16410 [Nicotiana attenuata]
MASLPAGQPARITQPKDPPEESRPTVALPPESKSSYSNAVAGTSSTGNAININTVVARQTTHNGRPAVIFKSSDYYGVMAENCKWTLVGKFTMGRPKIEIIRAKFIEQIPLKGKVRIRAYDYRHVFIEFNTEADFNTAYFQRFMSISRALMRMFKWSPDFDPNEETSLAPIWVLLPELPFHMFKWDYLRQVLEQIGTPMKEDIATVSRTRPHMAKVRVEVDLMKSLPDAVFVGIEGDTTGLKGRDQKLEYEGVPAFCRTCKLQGHDVERCKVEARKKEQAKTNRDNEKTEIREEQPKANIPGEAELKANTDGAQTHIENQKDDGFIQKSRQIEDKIIEAVQKEGKIQTMSRLKEVTTDKGKEIQSQQEGKTKEQESSSANSNNQIMSPFTADTACIQSKGGKITIDMGTLEHLQGELNNKHGPDIDNNSIYESGEDMDSNHSQEASTDDEITENSRGESEDDEDEQVADSLLEAFAPSPKQFDDPVAKETEEVIQKQGLSPRGNKRRNHKDSLLVVNMILGTYSTPWRLKEDVTRIQQKVQQHNIKIKHC